MKTSPPNLPSGHHPSHSWIDVITFDRLADAIEQKSALEEQRFEIRLHDERKLQKYWFWAPPQAGIHVQISADALPELRQRLKSNPALVSEKAVRCPSCDSTRVQYPQMTRKFLLPTLLAEAMVFLRLMGRECYCEDCHHTWARTPRRREATGQSGVEVSRRNDTSLNQNQGKVLVSLLTLLGTGLVVIGLTSWFWSWPVSLQAADKAEVAVDNSSLRREAKLSASFAPVVKRAAASVVYVYSTKTVKHPLGPELRPFFDDPFFRRFFGDQFGESEPRPKPRTEKQQSLGSGVIITKDGYILTNNHVVDGADEVKVALLDEKRDYTAKLVGRDPQTDLAVLKIDAKNLPPITMADSDKTEVGDVVLAIGNPFGIGQTVTMGIVSATQRGGMGIEVYEDFIQTDAAINPGNSGGALVDTEGRLVGINTAILSRSGGNQGVGFAVPANLARHVMDQILKKGRVERGYLGVSIQDLSPELAKEFDVPKGEGALVGGVTDGSAASEAGLQSGDVIIEFNGKPVEDSRSLRLMVGQTSPGAKVPLKVLRDRKEKTFTVTLKEMPDKLLAGEPGAVPGGDTEALRGVTVTDIDAAARRQFNLPGGLSGALVANIDADSAAFAAGLRQGDVIQEINRKPIRNAEDAVAATKNPASKRTLLRVWSRGGSRYLVVDESKEK